MDEEEFDSLLQWQTFDAVRADSQVRRRIALGLKLWGRTAEDLERQLLAPHPEIPADFELNDLRELERGTAVIPASVGDRRSAWLSPLALSGPAILIHGQSFTLWEARCEIVRRAIQYLQERG